MKQNRFSFPVVCGTMLIIVLTVVFVIVFGISPGELDQRKTTTTSVYATLITILLALLALAITAYIFLATSLKGRQENYEQETINLMLSKQTRHLLILTVFGIIFLAFCFLIDNGEINVPYADWMLATVIILASAEGVLLMCYTYAMIDYERGLLTTAKEERKKLFPTDQNEELAPLDPSMFKLIGDLEMLVMQLLHNHKDDFHDADTQDTLKSITSDNFVNTYQKLISYRDFLRVEKQKKGVEIKITKSEQQKVFDAIKNLEDSLKYHRLTGERLKNLNFIVPFLKQSKECFRLSGTVFTGSAFEGVDLSIATLQGADFSGARLNHVNLKGADCTEAVFSQAVFKELQVDSKTKFEKAVFRNTDFGRQVFSADEEGVYRFQNACFVEANLMECKFFICDFRYANFKNSMMAGIVLDSICLSYADFGGAILTNAKLQFQQDKAARFPREEYWQSSQLNEYGAPASSYTDRWRGRCLGVAFFANLERGVLSQACFSDYNFTGSRMADANFSDTKLENCIFDRCNGQRATFQEVLIRSCRFWHTMFSRTDFSYAEISDCDFSDVNMMGSLMVKTTVKGTSSQELSCFQRANFTNAQLRGCTFTDCDFRNALFVNADLTGTCFQNCDLTGAKFDGTDPDTFTVQTDCIGYVDKPEKSKGDPDMEENNRLELAEQIIWSRKSTRSFDSSATIEKELLERLLQAALQAPSPKNRQPWQFTIVTEKSAREKLAHILEQKLENLRVDRQKRGGSIDDLELAQGSVRVLRDASALVFVTYIRDEDNEHGDAHTWSLHAQPFEVADLQSIGAAVENMLLTASAAKIDSLWMCDVLYAYQEYVDHLGLKNPLVACVALGYQTPHHTPRFPLDEKVKWK